MASHARISRRRAVAAAATVTLALAPALALGSTASASAGPAVPGWRQVATASVDGWPSTELTSVSAGERQDAWALGDSYNGNYANGPTTLWRWNGKKWAQVTPPAPYASVLTREPESAIVRASGNVVWVIGPWQWLRYDGSSWTSGEMPGGGNLSERDAVSFGSEDAWVFGDDTGSAFAARTDGTTWTRTPLPNAAGYSVSAASGISGTDVWAVADYAGAKNLGGEVLRWDGQKWSALKLPASLSGQQFRPLSVFARSDSDVWVGGAIPHAGGGVSGVAHWNGHTWTVTVLGTGASPEPTGITDDGQGGVWILPSTDASPWQLWHYSGGRYTRVTPPGGPGLAELTRVPGTSSVWGVGTAAATPGTSATPGVIYLYGSVPG